MYQIHYDYVRPKKAAALKRLHAGAFDRHDNPATWCGTDATILPLRPSDQYGWTGQGGVIDKDGKYVDMSATYSFVNGTYPFTEPEYRDQKVVYCGYLVQHWGHFLVDAVNRLWYFLENDGTVDKYVFILTENEEREIKGNYKEFLVLLGIWDKIELINKPTKYREVIVPESGFQRGICYTPKYLSVFDTVAKNASVDPSWQPLEKIYWSRSRLPRARMYEFGFDAADNYFEKNGYSVLFPETIPLSQMIFYIQNAKTIATVSGSLPHNCFFGKQGQKLEILERCAFIDDWQVYVNIMKELDVTYLDAHLSVYTVSMVGPFIMGYTDLLEKFSADNGYLPPDDRFLTKKHYKTCFTQYMKRYQDDYRYRWFIDDYLHDTIDYHAEAYEYSRGFFDVYLNGSEPFLWQHYFMFHYWKQFVKRLLRK